MSHTDSPGLQLRSKKTTKTPSEKPEDSDEVQSSPATMSMTTRSRGEQQTTTCKTGNGNDQVSESHGEPEPNTKRRSVSGARTPGADIKEGSMELRRRSSSTTPGGVKPTSAKSTPDSKSLTKATGSSKALDRSATPTSSPARRSSVGERQGSATNSGGEKSTPTSGKASAGDGKGSEKIKTRGITVKKPGSDSKPSTPLKPPPLKYEGPAGRKRPSLPSPDRRPGESGGASPSKRKRTIRKSPSGQDTENDFFCWTCHKEGNVICCELCPRVYHGRCLGVDKGPPGDWVCPECQKIMQAECTDTRSKAMSILTVDQLCMLLKFALQRMKTQGSEPFHKPVDLHDVPNYTDYIFCPMDLCTLEKNIKKKMYGSTEAFLADTKWILHNCIIFNGAHHKLSAIAKAIVKICRHEMSEIEICPDCYTNSCLKKNDNWFCEPCRTPHPLVWAKLKGYPFWAAKALRVMNGQVDVRFFGAHDRAWVPMSQVYLLSRDPPVPVKAKKSGYDESIDELELHISRITGQFGSFNFSPFRTPYDSAHLYNPFKASKQKTPKGSPAKRLKLSTTSPVVSPAKSTSSLSSASSGVTSPVSPRKVGLGSKLSGVKRPLGGKEEKPKSIASKTASALKSKYNTMTTRRAGKPALQSGSDQSDLDQSKTDKTVKSVADNDTAEHSSQKESDLVKSSPLPGEGEVSQAKSSTDHLSNGEIHKDQQRSKSVSESSGNSLDRSSPVSGEEKVSRRSSVDRNVFELQFTDTSEEVKTDSHAGMTVITDKVDPHQDEKETNVGVEPSIKQDSKVDPSADTIEVKSVLKNSSSEGEPIDNSADSSKEVDNQKDMDSSLKSDTLPVSDVVATEEKRNPFLKNLVESCKAKLGITCEEELKGDDSAIEEEESGEAEDSGKTSESSSAEETSTSDSSEEEEEDEEENKSGDQYDSEEKKPKSGAQTLAETSEMGADTQKETCISVPEEKISIPNSQESPDSAKEIENSNKLETDSSVEKIKSQGDTVIQDADTTSVSEIAHQAKVNTVAVSDSKDEHFDSSSPQKKDVEYMGKNDGKSVENTEGTEIDMVPEITGSESPDLPKQLEESMDTSEKKPERSEERNSKERQTSPKAEVVLDSSGSSKRKRRSSESDLVSDSDESSQLVIDLSMEERDAGKSSPKLGKLNQGSSITEDSLVVPHGVALRVKEKVWRERQWQRKVKQHQTQKPTEDNVGSEDLPSRYKPITPAPTKVSSTSSSTSTPASAAVPAIHSPPRLEPDPQVAAPPSASHMTSTPANQTNAALPESSVSSSLAPSLTNLLPGFDVGKYTSRVLDSVKSSLEDLYNDIMTSEANGLMMKSVTQEMQKLQWRHFQELKEMRHNIDLTLKEMRTSLEEEKKSAVAAAKQQMETERNKAIEETKKKQWCANCGKEAMFYCCWNTSYCDYPCQQAHWPHHMNVCTQTQAASQSHDHGGSQLESGLSTADMLTDQAWKSTARDSLSAALKRQEHERLQHQQQQQQQQTQRAPTQFGQSVSSSNQMYIHPQMIHSQNMQSPVVPYGGQPMSQPMMRQPGMNYQSPQQQIGMAGQPIMQQRPVMQPGGAAGPVMYLRPQQPLMLARQPSPVQQSVGMMRPSPSQQQSVGMMRGSPMYQPRSF